MILERFTFLTVRTCYVVYPFTKYTLHHQLTD